jgi:hypothetical protein
VDGIVYFFIIHFDPQSFILDDLILIKGQLLQIFYSRMELEK